MQGFGVMHAIRVGTKTNFPSLGVRMHLVRFCHCVAHGRQKIDRSSHHHFTHVCFPLPHVVQFVFERRGVVRVGGFFGQMFRIRFDGLVAPGVTNVFTAPIDGMSPGRNVKTFQHVGRRRAHGSVRYADVPVLQQRRVAAHLFLVEVVVRRTGYITKGFHRRLVE